MRIPVATYRLQFCRDFTFADATGLVEYLHDLGITDVYSSPVFVARSGSTHGYDVIDHSRINPELGGEEGFTRMAEELRRRGMGILLDVVPNHMCIAGDANRLWIDVLESGPASAFARFFDIDWRPPKAELSGRVLLPVLGEQFGRVLETDLATAYADGGFALWYDSTRLPLAPRTWPHILEPALAEVRQRLGDEEPTVLELESIIRAISHLPLRTDTAPAKVRERQHELKMIRRRLASLMDESPAVRAAAEHAMTELNGRRGDPRSFDRLEALVAEQAYRLSHWRVAAHEINYRRFFDINELAAIRVEDPVVFETVHRLPFELARRGLITGLRIDHVDGLFDPEKYLGDLQRGWRAATGAAGEAPAYVVVEKILAPDERLPRAWPVAGTTGYEFAELVTSVLVDSASAQRLREIAARFVGSEDRFADVVYRSKKLVLRSAMSAELIVLARKLDRISEQHRYTRDFTLNSLLEILTEVVACFPVYRTYLRPGENAVGEADRHAIDVAIRLAKRRNPVTNATLFDFVRSVLLLEAPDGLSEAQLAERREFVLRFQQLSGPVMAKGLEDTAFYRYFPLAALNEVGGNPDAIGLVIEEFHRKNAERAALGPHGLLATATHDTKRGEETRARLLVLSEIPDAWEAAVNRWRELNRGHRAVPGEAPDAAEEYLYYQTLVGAWPLEGLAAAPGFVARMQEYMTKALLEAKVHTSWVNRNEPYETAVRTFIAATLDPARAGAFLDEFTRFHATVERAGTWNALAQLVLKVASPGVPDFYQGTELPDLSLVDPDNRRPVDYGHRRALLASLRVEAERDPRALAAALCADPTDGRLKMFVTMRALHLRRSRRALFERGGYEPVTVEGTRHEHVVAFARPSNEGVLLAVTGRHFARMGAAQRPPVGAAWDDTRLLLPRAMAPRRFWDAITGNTLVASRDGALSLADLLSTLPVALLEAV